MGCYRKLQKQEKIKREKENLEQFKWEVGTT